MIKILTIYPVKFLSVFALEFWWSPCKGWRPKILSCSQFQTLKILVLIWRWLRFRLYYIDMSSHVG